MKKRALKLNKKTVTKLSNDDLTNVGGGIITSCTPGAGDCCGGGGLTVDTPGNTLLQVPQFTKF